MTTNTTTTTQATYSKLRDGSWGIRVAGPAHAGQTVTVTKRSGETSIQTVGEVIWTDGSVSLCRIGTARPATAAAASAPQRRRRGTWTGCSCGSIEEEERRGDCFTCRHDR